MHTYRRDIDGLRALAVIAVVLNHAQTPGFGGGFLGVDIFFVISGFLITQILVKTDGTPAQSIARFYERRVRRIAPALIAVLVASTVAAAILFSPPELERFAGSLMASTAFGANVYFQQTTDYFNLPFETPLLHLWSLGVEEQFYIVYPLLLWTVSRFFPRLLLPVLGVLCLFSFAMSQWLTQSSPVQDFYFTGWRAWELLLGALVALRPLRLSIPQVAQEGLAGLGLLMLAVPDLLYTRFTPWPGIHALLPCAGTALLLGLHDTRRTLVSRMLSTPPLVGIGLISYSLYLWHWPLFEFFQRRVLHPPTAVQYTALIAVAAVLAALSWRFVEQPFRTTGIGRRTVFATAAAAALLLLGTGAAIMAEEGFPQRFTPAVQKIYAAIERRFGDEGQNRVGICNIDSTEPNYALDSCWNASAQQRNIVLWGDSHARSLNAGLQAQARRAGVNLIQATHGACLPTFGGDENPNSCTAFNRAVFERLNSRISAVVLAGRFSLFHSRLPGLVELVRQITRKGIPVVVIGPTPESLEPLPFYLARYAQTGDAAVLKLAQTQLPILTKLDGKMRELFTGKERESYVSIIHAVCSNDACPLTVNGEPTLFDSNHLTMAASLAYGTVLWPKITAALSKPAAHF